MKKVLALLLVLCMAFAMMPVMAFAEDGGEQAEPIRLEWDSENGKFVIPEGVTLYAGDALAFPVEKPTITITDGEDVEHTGGLLNVGVDWSDYGQPWDAAPGDGDGWHYTVKAGKNVLKCLTIFETEADASNNLTATLLEFEAGIRGAVVADSTEYGTGAAQDTTYTQTYENVNYTNDYELSFTYYANYNSQGENINSSANFTIDGYTINLKYVSNGDGVEHDGSDFYYATMTVLYHGQEIVSDTIEVDVATTVKYIFKNSNGAISFGPEGGELLTATVDGYTAAELGAVMMQHYSGWMDTKLTNINVLAYGEPAEEEETVELFPVFTDALGADSADLWSGDVGSLNGGLSINWGGAVTVTSLLKYDLGEDYSFAFTYKASGNEGDDYNAKSWVKYGDLELRVIEFATTIELRQGGEVIASYAGVRSPGTSFKFTLVYSKGMASVLMDGTRIIAPVDVTPTSGNNAFEVHNGENYRSSSIKDLEVKSSKVVEDEYVYIPKVVTLVPTGEYTVKEGDAVGGAPMFALPEGTVLYVGDQIKIPLTQSNHVCADGAHYMTVWQYTDGWWSDDGTFDSRNINYTCTEAGEKHLLATGGSFMDDNWIWVDLRDVVIYFTVLPTPTADSAECEHADTTVVGAIDATCGEDGFSGDSYCTACGEKIADGEAIPATGEHAWGDWIADEDGDTETRECSVCGDTESQEVVKNYVAELNGTNYEILADAIAAAQDGDTVTLIDDVVLTERIDVRKDITIDLDGKTITADIDDAYGAIYVAASGKLTVKGEGSIINTAGYAIGNYGVLVVENGTISGEYASIYNFYYNATTYGTATINGGAIEGEIWNCGKLAVNGGEIAMIDNSGALAVNGGTVAEIYARDGSDAAGVEGSGTITIANPESVSVPEGYELVEVSEGVYKVAVKECEHEYGNYVNNEDGTQTGTCAHCGETGVVTNAVGPNITWTLEDGVLTLTGTGATFDYINVGNINPFIEHRFDIQHIVIGDGITHIGNRVFRGLNHTYSVTFGKDVVSTGYECFYGCTKLNEVELNDGLEALGSLVFYNCIALEEIDLPETLTRMDNRTFKKCSALKEIVIPDTVIYTGYEVFMDCTALSSVKFSENCSLVNSCVFMNCTSLTEFTVPEMSVRIRSNAFTGSGLLTLNFTDERNLTANSNGDARIASNAFDGCSSELTFKSFDNLYVKNYALSKGFNFEVNGVLGLSITTAGDYVLDNEEIIATSKDADAVYASGTDVNVTINGGYYDGGDNGSTTAVYARNTAVVTINGGTFKAGEGSAVVYAKNAAKVYINNGFFEADGPYEGEYFVLNLGDNTNASIVVKGGTFVNFDPSNANTEPGGPVSFVAEGYSVVAEEQANGDVWYTVVEDNDVLYTEAGSYTVNDTIVGAADDTYAVKAMGEGVDVTINGGSYDTTANENAATIYARDGAVITINDGEFKGGEGAAVVYAKNNATVVINGGFFEAAGPYLGEYFVLNLSDNTNSNIIVKGGTFVNFDPSNANTEPGAASSFVADGYTVVAEEQANGDVWYTVVAI